MSVLHLAKPTISPEIRVYCGAEVTGATKYRWQVSKADCQACKDARAELLPKLQERENKRRARAKKLGNALPVGRFNGW